MERYLYVFLVKKQAVRHFCPCFPLVEEHEPTAQDVPAGLATNITPPITRRVRDGGVFCIPQPHLWGQYVTPSNEIHQIMISEKFYRLTITR